VGERLFLCIILICTLFGHRSSALRLLPSAGAWDSLAKRATASLLLPAALILNPADIPPAHAGSDAKKSIGDISVKFDGRKRPMREFLGREATLIVNFAGQCGEQASGDLNSSHLFSSLLFTSLFFCFLFFKCWHRLDLRNDHFY
jgi:hypothetical protein